MRAIGYSCASDPSVREEVELRYQLCAIEQYCIVNKIDLVGVYPDVDKERFTSVRQDVLAYIARNQRKLDAVVVVGEDILKNTVLSRLRKLGMKVLTTGDEI